MKSKGYTAAFALIILALVSPAQADIVIDQSRISLSSPRSTGFDNLIWQMGKGSSLNY